MQQANWGPKRWLTFLCSMLSLLLFFLKKNFSDWEFVITVVSTFSFFFFSLSLSPSGQAIALPSLSIFGNSTGQNPGTRHQFWRRIRHLPVCLVSPGNFRWNQITRLPLLSWRNTHYSPHCKFFDPNSGILAPSDQFNFGSWFGWDLRRKKNGYLWRK